MQSATRQPTKPFAFMRSLGARQQLPSPGPSKRAYLGKTCIPENATNARPYLSPLGCTNERTVRCFSGNTSRKYIGPHGKTSHRSLQTRANRFLQSKAYFWSCNRTHAYVRYRVYHGQRTVMLSPNPVPLFWLENPGLNDLAFTTCLQ